MLYNHNVFDNLQRLLAGKPLLKHHTQAGYHPVAEVPLVKRPITSAAIRKSQISETSLKHAEMIGLLKKRNAPRIRPMPRSMVSLSQSELHLKVMLGKDYQENNLLINIKRFFDKCFTSDEVKKLNCHEKTELMNLCNQLIMNEKRHNKKQLFFYHACDKKVKFLYTIYTLIYQKLHAHYSWPVFRADKQNFDSFPSIHEFIDYYSNGGKEEINNNSEGYHECVLSTNIFLFGNHDQTTSCSIDVMLRNQTSRDIDLAAALIKLLQPFSVSIHEISQLIDLYNAHEERLSGSLFQIAVPKKMINGISYPAGSLGVMNKYEGEQDLSVILRKLAASCNEPSDHASSKAAVYSYVKQLQARLFLSPDFKVYATSIS